MIRGTTQILWIAILVSAIMFVAGCNEDSSDSPSDCEDGETRCDGGYAQACIDGSWSEGTLCSDENKLCKQGVCVAPEAVTTCEAGTIECSSDKAYHCNADGTGYEKVESCNDGIPCTFDGCTTDKGCTHAKAPDNTPCQGEDLCKLGDSCQDGECVEGTETLVCNDYNVCTNDSCDAVFGCTFVPNTASCDDENACTTGDTCYMGACNGAAVEVDDGNPCTRDECLPDSGVAHYNLTGTSCDDANPCTTDDACNAGVCEGTPMDCTHLDEECRVGICNPYGTACTSIPRLAGVECDDGNPATVNDVCIAGGICMGTVCVCDTEDDCCDGCNAINDTGTCNDDNLCTEGDVCGGGVCAGTAIVCDDSSACTDDSCNPEDGQCVYDVIVTCDDSDNCTTDSCNPENGQCVYDAVVCNDDDNCTTDSCNPENGQCVYDTITCDDDNECTTDVCNTNDGTCSNEVTVTCNDDDKCTTDSCNPEDGQCVYEAVVCDDSDNCTTDSCNPEDGQCVYDAITCDDDNECTTDVCNTNDGTCSNEVTVTCNDDDNCTTDSCNPENGQCVYDPITCNDDDLCTTDVCNQNDGSCSNEVAVTCDDDDKCTTDSCNPEDGLCVYEAVVCDDSDNCTTDSCNDADGTCLYEAVVCNDNSECTTDACNPDDGQCVYTNSVDCDDQDLCTVDTCDPLDGTCDHEAVDCDDSNACTDDACNPEDGSCDHDDVVCNDDDACTTDTCNTETGCSYDTTVVCDETDCSTLGQGVCQPADGSCVYPDAFDVYAECNPEQAGYSCDATGNCVERTGQTCDSPLNVEEGTTIEADFTNATDDFHPTESPFDVFNLTGVDLVYMLQFDDGGTPPYQIIIDPADDNLLLTVLVTELHENGCEVNLLASQDTAVGGTYTVDLPGDTDNKYLIIDARMPARRVSIDLSFEIHFAPGCNGTTCFDTQVDGQCQKKVGWCSYPAKTSDPDPYCDYEVLSGALSDSYTLGLIAEDVHTNPAQYSANTKVCGSQYGANDENADWYSFTLYTAEENHTWKIDYALETAKVTSPWVISIYENIEGTPGESAITTAYGASDSLYITPAGDYFLKIVNSGSESTAFEYELYTWTITEVPD